MPRSSRQSDHTKTSDHRREMQSELYGHVSRSSRLAKTILQGTVKGRRRQGSQKKSWKEHIREWSGLEVCQVPEGSGEQGEMKKTVCEVICGVPTTLAVNS